MTVAWQALLGGALTGLHAGESHSVQRLLGIQEEGAFKCVGAGAQQHRRGFPSESSQGNVARGLCDPRNYQ